jgi:hypothetical protein
MPDHTIFNERPESQDRALKVIERLGYTIVPRSEAERKRGSRKAVLFTEELQAFLSKPTGLAVRQGTFLGALLPERCRRWIRTVRQGFMPQIRRSTS